MAKVAKSQHYKHAKKIMNWRGRMTKQRVNMAIDEVVRGMKETLPKYYKTKSGFLINLHDALA